MRSFLWSLLLLGIALSVPILPLIVWGEFFAGAVSSWQESPPDRVILAVAVAAILASDVLLPVPSGPVATLAGAQLGIGVATLSCWLGLTTGALVAFALARYCGRPLALRLASADDLDRLEDACRTHDIWMLVATRPLPILAEACVLLVGLLGSHWRRVVPAVSSSNLAIALIYSTMGGYAAAQHWLVIAVCLSLAIPILLTLWVRHAWKANH